MGKNMEDYISTAEGVQQMWDRINEIMDNFDFAKVAKVMNVLNWGWAFSNEDTTGLEEDGLGCYIPGEKHLMKTARDLMVETIKRMPNGKRSYSIATGGFKVEVTIEDYSKDDCGELPPDDFKHMVSLSLSFVVEEWESYWD